MAWDPQLFERASGGAWDYQLVEWTTGAPDGAERLKPVLASMGNDGWELVTVVSSLSGRAGEVTFIFKKARPAAPSFRR